MAKKKHIVIVATGGTIAGQAACAHDTSYSAGVLDIEQLMATVPGISLLATISTEQFAHIGSQDIDDTFLLTLARRCNQLLQRDDVDGIVITHGTDTMEETAYFLHLTVHSGKPVVLTGAMRPANVHSADGPMNLYEAVATAAAPETMNRGVMVVANDAIWGARDVTKSSTTALHSFSAPGTGPLGHVYRASVDFLRSPSRRHTAQSELSVDHVTQLPPVAIVYAHGGTDNTIAIDAFVQAGYRGIVHAGFGNGNFHDAVGQALKEAVAHGVIVVRSSRVSSGPTTEGGEVDDELTGFIPSGHLPPHKARMLVQLGLVKSQERAQLRSLFRYY